MLIPKIIVGIGTYVEHKQDLNTWKLCITRVFDEQVLLFYFHKNRRIEDNDEEKSIVIGEYDEGACQYICLYKADGYNSDSLVNSGQIMFKTVIQIGMQYIYVLCPYWNKWI